MSTNMTVNQQWRNRPSDQRFLTLQDLHNSVAKRRSVCAEETVALDCLQVQSTDKGDVVLLNRESAGGASRLTHWAFGQLCTRAHAPAGFLRSLPAEIAVPALQWKLETHETEADEGNDAKLLIRRAGGDSQLRSVTSATYGRIYDAEVTAALLKHVDQDIWKVPSASYSKEDPMRATTLYASDHDIFIFLVDEGRPIEVCGELLNRGFYVWNSEVGSATFGFASFTYDHVCDNRIIWNCGNFSELKIRHTAGGPHRFVARAVPQLGAFAGSSDAKVVETVRAAKAIDVGKDRDEVLEWMRKRGFTTGMAKKSYDAAVADRRGYNPRTVWGLVQGATAAAREVKYQDDRVALEAQAGQLLNDLME